MIPVMPADEPADFDEKVRQKGLYALAELVGEAHLPKWPGTRSGKRPGKRLAKIADHRDQIPPDSFPAYWTAALPDMLQRYQRLCAYLALYIEDATGNPSIDHFKPKSLAWDKAYEWSNYRLASAYINANKGIYPLLLDPFTIAPETFALELIAFQVKPGARAVGVVEAQAWETIERLGLNKELCCAQRETYFEAYRAGEISLAYLTRRAPFLAQEMRRQNQLLLGDA